MVVVLLFIPSSFTIMAYDENLAKRIRNIFAQKNITFTEKKMIGGLCFMIDDKMCCGIHIDKKLNDNLLMTRIGEVAFEKEVEKESCMPMDFTGKPMKDYAFILPEGFEHDEALGYWLDLCIAFNPLAKASKKKK